VNLRPALVFAPVLAALTGCQTITEEMPTRSSSPISPTLPIVVVVPISNPGTPGSAPAAPTPAPTATPAPVATPTPAPQPTAAPAPDRGPIDSIRVGFFGISCKNGKAEPRNGERKLPVGCTGFVTATPKDKNNIDVPARIHGPDISWNLMWGNGTVDVRKPTFPSDFNKDVAGLRVGEFSLCATVKGVEGCLHGFVIP
jgi:hypothetical protein